MGQENVEIARQAVEAFLAGDWERAFQDFDQAVIWEETPGLGPDADTYRGVEAAREASEKWLEMWAEYEFSVERYVDAGDDVVVLARERGHGSASGATVEREFAEVSTFREGKIIRNRLFANWAEALEAAGWSE